MSFFLIPVIYDDVNDGQQRFYAYTGHGLFSFDGVFGDLPSWNSTRFCQSHFTSGVRYMSFDIGANMNLHDRAVWGALKSMSDESGWVRSPLRVIASEAGVSINTVRRATTDLANLGVVERYGGRRGQGRTVEIRIIGELPC